jgi:hypothetical protein
MEDAADSKSAGRKPVWVRLPLPVPTASRAHHTRPKTQAQPTTDKNGEGMDHPVDHLVCYRFKGENVAQPAVIRNQFESPKVKIKSIKGRELCVPSAKVTWEDLADPKFPPP